MVASPETPAAGAVKPEILKCETHGEYEVRTIAIGKGIRLDKCPKCTEAAASAERAAQAEVERARRLEWVQIPPRFMGCTFENFVMETSEQRRALQVCAEYAADFQKFKATGAGMIMNGRVGTGKTHLACAVLAALAPKHRVRYTTAGNAIRFVRSAWGGNGQEGDKYRELATLDLLVIDEIGVQHKSESEQVILTEIINMRYEKVLPTIVISNENRDGIKALLGERAFDRMRGGLLIPFEWESRRGRV